MVLHVISGLARVRTNRNAILGQKKACVFEYTGFDSCEKDQEELRSRRIRKGFVTTGVGIPRRGVLP